MCVRQVGGRTNFTKTMHSLISVFATGAGNHEGRAKLVAKMLMVAGKHKQVKIGLGCDSHARTSLRQGGWIDDFDLDDYVKKGGQVITDGVGGMISEINSLQDEEARLVCISPCQNIRDALKRDPGIAHRVHFIGMHGAVRTGYFGKPDPVPEFNVKNDVPVGLVPVM